MSDVVRVALCDDHAVVRTGLRKILEDESDVEVVGEAATATEAVSVAGMLQPDVFVLDLGLPDAHGLSAIRRILDVSPDSKVLVLTMHDEVDYLREAFRAGAQGYLSKEAADVELLLAVRALAAGKRHVQPALGAALLSEEPPGSRGAGPTSELSTGPTSELSSRETEILRLVALGHTNPEIGTKLNLSVRTVETHRAHIQQKLGLRSRAQLAQFARTAGLLD